MPISAAVRNAVVADVAVRHRIAPRDMLSPSRTHAVAHARQEAMARLRAITRPDGSPRYSLPEIGRAFGRDHTTVLFALRQHERRARDA